MHVRTQIRDRVAALLAHVGTVYKARVYPTGECALPVVLVSCGPEQMEPVTLSLSSGYQLERVLAIIVEARVADCSDLDEALNELAVAIETALGADPTLGGAAHDSHPVAIEVSRSGDGRQPIGAIRMTFEVRYSTSTVDPETLI